MPSQLSLAIVPKHARAGHLPIPNASNWNGVVALRQPTLSPSHTLPLRGQRHAAFSVSADETAQARGRRQRQQNLLIMDEAQIQHLLNAVLAAQANVQPAPPAPPVPPPAAPPADAGTSEPDSTLLITPPLSGSRFGTMPHRCP